MTTVLPAYGRNYAKASDAQRDWHEGKDFLESSTRLACNRQDLPGDIVIRYGKRLEKVCAYDAKVSRNLDKLIAIEKQNRPVQPLDFNAWMKELDKHVIAASGMSYQDLPDIDFRAIFDAACTPYSGAEAVLTEAGFN